MGTPIQKEFGPGYDCPPRKFHFWAVILPTVVLIALAVALMRDTASTSSKLTRSPIVTCPKQMCPAPGATESAQPATESAQPTKKTSTSAAGLSAAETTASDSSSPTATSASGRASSQPSSPSPSSNLTPARTSPSPGSPSSPSASPALSATRALLTQSSPAVTHAVVLSSA
jgi:hypothetical protein